MSLVFKEPLALDGNYVTFYVVRNGLHGYLYECSCSQTQNKKVLLLERKRHTTCRVASARYAGGGGVPHPVMGGTPSSHDGGGVPHPVMVGDTPSSHGEGGSPSSHGGGHPIQSCWGGTPSSHGEYPIQSWGVPISGGYPGQVLIWGYPG